MTEPVTYDYGYYSADEMGDNHACLTIATWRGDTIEVVAVLHGHQANAVHGLLKEIEARTKTEPSNSTQGPSNRSEDVPINSG
jgi:hypothetical protein